MVKQIRFNWVCLSSEKERAGIGKVLITAKLLNLNLLFI